MNHDKIKYAGEGTDVIVIGGGHGGCEAALAAARMGVQVLLFAISLDSIALMPCNPNIGGTSKGHLVREIDALGGEMGRNIDKSFIQSRMLNTSKGPAVHSLRVQADKAKYAGEMRRTLENTPGLSIRQGEIVDLVFDGEIKGVVSETGCFYPAGAVVICSGTYLNARILYGETIIPCGPNGLKAATGLTEALKKLGVNMLRFKTGTPARLDGRTVDFSRMEEQKGDEDIVPFSFDHTPEEVRREQISCYLTYTNEETHRIIRENIHRAPMYSGAIEGTGTRYCPSIEDKIVRFADKDRHQIFIEPEGESTNEMYVSGMSTSMPEDVQLAMYRTIPGLENCKFTRNGYAIEYDCIDATQLTVGLAFKALPGLFSAGQINGSSGYEEAAAQGLVAGMNAANRVLGREEFIIDRSEGYIGVLIDDLVVKGTREPYRMMTSRAEYRLLLRQDNADLRLREKGYKAGIISKEKYETFLMKRDNIDREIKRVGAVNIPPSGEVNHLLKSLGSSEIHVGIKLVDLIKRPELSYDSLKAMDENRPALPQDVREQVNISIKYEGYIEKQLAQVEQYKRMENKTIPLHLDYNHVPNLRLEARQKLNALKPRSIGQAGRITGVSPADIGVLTVFLEKYKVDASKSNIGTK